MADDLNESLETLSEGDKQLVELAKSLANDPKTRKEFLKLVRAKHPEQPIPELDTEAAMQKFAEPYIKELADLKKERLSEKVEREIEKRRLDLKEQGFNADDVKAIEELMVKEQIPNYATAAKFYRQGQQLATPTPSATSLVNKAPVDGKLVKEAGGIKNWARNEAAKAFDEIRAGRVKLH